MSKINCKFSQVILYVQEMDRSVHLYHDLLGLPINYPKEAADYAQEMWVELDAGGCTLALHGGARTLPDDKHELIFTVKDIQSAREELIAAGIAMGAIRPLETSEPIASGLDPNGHRFSIREKA